MVQGRLDFHKYTKTEPRKLVFHRRVPFTGDSIVPEIEILTDADAFEFNRNMIFYGGKFTPLTDLVEETGAEEYFKLRSHHIYGKLISISGATVWLGHKFRSYHLELDQEGKLVIPVTYQERQIVCFAHGHILYGHMILSEAEKIMATCEHKWGSVDEDLGGCEPWECRRCGLGYSIGPGCVGEGYKKIHDAYQSNWPKEVSAAFRMFPALILSGLGEELRWGGPQLRYAPPATTGIWAPQKL